MIVSSYHSMIEREKEKEQKVTPTHHRRRRRYRRLCPSTTFPSPPSLLPSTPPAPHPPQVKGKDKQLGDLLPSIIAPHIVAR